MIYFFKTENGSWILGRNSTRDIVPSGTYRLGNNQNDNVTFIPLSQGLEQFQANITDIAKNANGDKYTVIEFDEVTTDFFVNATQSLAARVAELEEKQTLFVDYWDVVPVDPQEEQIMFVSADDELSIYFNAEWLIIPLSVSSIYVNRATNIQYAWSGSVMVALTFPLTKAAIEALLTGQISSHTHAADATKLDATKAAVEALVYTDKQTLAALNIDLATAEVFEKTLTGATAFTISNPRNFKPFRLILTGGSLSVPTFTGYTVNWILTSLVTDYVNTISNVLWCEIRSAGQIYCFWGN